MRYFSIQVLFNLLSVYSCVSTVGERSILLHKKYRHKFCEINDIFLSSFILSHILKNIYIKAKITVLCRIVCSPILLSPKLNSGQSFLKKRPEQTIVPNITSISKSRRVCCYLVLKIY